MAGNPLETESLTCPICLDLLSNPVAIPCGHSFCFTCIDHYWPLAGDRYKCPQCRKSFRNRPALNKNIMLADLVEQIKKSSPTSDHYAGSQDVSCDVCKGLKLKAVKSCLQCLVSFCESHLQPHRDVPVLKKHQLVSPSKELQENICHEHNEVKKMFCRTDQMPVCVVCCMSGHKDHDTVFSDDEKAQNQAELEAMIDLLKNKVLYKQADLQRLDANKMMSSHFARSAELYCKEIFDEIGNLLMKTQTEVYQYITSQLRTEMVQHQSLKKELHQEILTLMKNINDVKKLASTQEHNLFLLDPSTGSPHHKHTLQQPTHTRGANSTSILKRPMDFENVIKALKDFRKKFPLSVGDFKLTEPVPLQSAPQPVTRQDLLHYRQEIMLDPTTAHAQLLLTDNNRKAKYERKTPMLENKFIYGQVLSKHRVISRAYWEVEVSQATNVCVAVAYKDCEGVPSANGSSFGYNNKSWALKCDNKKYFFCFDSVQSDIMGPVRPRIGVYLDHVAGLLCFYTVSEDSTTLLHKVQTTFTRPLHAGLALGNHGDSARFASIGF